MRFPTANRSLIPIYHSVGIIGGQYLIRVKGEKDLRLATRYVGPECPKYQFMMTSGPGDYHKLEDIEDIYRIEMSTNKQAGWGG